MDLTTDLPTPVPNHHADQPGFSGARGLGFAVLFGLGRRRDSALAVRLSGTGRGDHVVDVGCGPGTAVRAAAATGARPVGVDPAPVMLRVARLWPNLRRRARYVEGGAEALPLPDDSATVLWSLASVHHWPDVRGGLAEAARVLRPGGRLLAIERRSPVGAVGVASHGWTDEQAEVFADMCRDAGFVDAVVSVEQGWRNGGEALSVLAHRPVTAA